MPTNQDETLQQRYTREYQDYPTLCGNMTAEQVADLQLQLNNALGRETALQQRLTIAEQRNAVVDIEAAAETLSNCMDYPWEHMPENGRVLMRKHAKNVIDAALNPAESGESHE